MAEWDPVRIEPAAPAKAAVDPWAPVSSAPAGMFSDVTVTAGVPDYSSAFNEELGLGESIIRGLAQGGERFAGFANLLLGMPAAKLIDTVTGGDGAQDMIGGMVAENYRRVNEYAPQSAETQGLGSEVAQAVASFLPDLATTLATGGAGAGANALVRPAINQGVGRMVAANLEQAAATGVRSSAIPAAERATELGKDVSLAGGSLPEALGAAATGGLATALTNAIPASASGNVLARTIQGAASNPVADLAQTAVENIALPDRLNLDQQMSGRDLLVSAIIGGPLGAGLGERGPDRINDPDAMRLGEALTPEQAWRPVKAVKSQEPEARAAAEPITAPVKPASYAAAAPDVLDSLLTEELQPRAPALPEVAKGASREQLVEEWRTAPSPELKAAAAAKIAALDATQPASPAGAESPVAEAPPAADSYERFRRPVEPAPTEDTAPQIVDRTAGGRTFRELAPVRAAVDEAVKTGSAGDLLRSIETQAASDDQRFLAGKLAPIMDSLGVKLVDAPDDSDLGGGYNNADNTVFINQATNSNVLHEMLHGATSALLTNPEARANNPDVRQAAGEFDQMLTELRAHATSRAGLDDTVNAILDTPGGPLANVKELLAYGMTDSRFQRYLESLPAPKGIQARNLWDAFKGAIAKLLGKLTPKQRTFLDQVIESGGSLVDFAGANPDVARQAQQSEAARLRPEVDASRLQDLKAEASKANQALSDVAKKLRAEKVGVEQMNELSRQAGEILTDIAVRSGVDYGNAIREAKTARKDAERRVKGNEAGALKEARELTLDIQQLEDARRELRRKEADARRTVDRVRKLEGQATLADRESAVVALEATAAAARDTVEKARKLRDWRAGREKSVNDARKASAEKMDDFTQAEGIATAVPWQAKDSKFTPIQEVADAARAKLQDRMIAARRAQEGASPGQSPAGVTTALLDDAMNFYRLENLSHGAALDRWKQFDAFHVKPLENAMKRTGVTMEQLEDFRLAQHAPERNAQIAKINPDMPDGGAGVTSQWAADYLAGNAPGVYSKKPLDSSNHMALDALSKRLNGIRDDVLKMRVESGQIPQEMADRLDKAYQYYVPLKGKSGDDKPSGAGARGLSVIGTGIKRALGRGEGNVAKNLVGEMIADGQRAIVAVEKAKVGQALLRFALANPNDALYKVEPVDLEYKFSEATGEAYPAVKNSQKDVDETLIVPWKGKSYRIRFEDEGLQRAVLAMGPEDLRGLVRVIGSINRWRSSILTKFNPAFPPVNIIRDLIFGTTAIGSERGSKVLAKAVGWYPIAMRAMYRDVRGKSTASGPKGKKAQEYAREWSELGGKTGLTQVEQAEDIQKRIRLASQSLGQLAADGRPIRAVAETIKRTGGPILQLIEDVNDAAENALRLAVYITEREDGVSKGKAAEYSKNVTINFNRKGEWGSALNAIYLFYNASMQGTHAVARVLRSPKVLAGLVAFGGLQALLANSMMDDEDNDGVTNWDMIPDYVKRTSFVIPLGWKTGNAKDYVSIPLPYGFNLFPYSGGRIAQWVKHGGRPTDKSLFTDVLSSTTESFSPVPVTEGPAAFAGDLPSFLIGLYANKDDQGRQITQEDAYSDYQEPRALMGRASTPEPFQVAARVLARAGGGDLEQRKVPIRPFDWSPEELSETFDYALGGIANIMTQSNRAIEQGAAGNIADPYEAMTVTPILKRFVGRGNETRAVTDRYYAEKGELARKKDVLQDKLKTPGADVDQILVDAAVADPTMVGLSADRYKKGGKRGGPGDLKRTESGGVELNTSDLTSLGALKAAEKKTKAINKAIKSVRAGKLTNQEIVGIAEEMLTELTADKKSASVELGLPSGFDGKAVAPSRIRQRAIKLLQDQRATEQQYLLTSLKIDRKSGDE